MSGTGLPALNSQHPKHSLKKLVHYLALDAVKGSHVFQEGPHSALEDARATMTVSTAQGVHREEKEEDIIVPENSNRLF